jgi:hypothetical protein
MRLSYEARLIDGERQVYDTLRNTPAIKGGSSQTGDR